MRQLTSGLVQSMVDSLKLSAYERRTFICPFAEHQGQAPLTTPLFSALRTQYNDLKYSKAFMQHLRTISLQIRVINYTWCMTNIFVTFAFYKDFLFLINFCDLSKNGSSNK